MVVHSVYSMYHLSRKAGARTPASSAAYQLFSAFSDLCVLPLYTYGTLSIRNNSSDWGTAVAGGADAAILIATLYYTLISAGGVHLLTLIMALWLGLKFRQITLMPPDMNPLEDHFTSRTRQHVRNKSSVATTSAASERDRRLSTPYEERRRSGFPYEDVGRGPVVPFAHTRAGSAATSLRNRDSRVELPSRQYGSRGNSPRNSVVSAEELSAIPPPIPRHQSNRSHGSYMEIPLHETNSPHPNTGNVASQVNISNAGPGATTQPQRAAKFTEAWYASESLINRTQQRNRAVNTMLPNATGKRRTYDPLNQANDDELDDDDIESGSELAPDADENNDSGQAYESDGDIHPNPLRSNPARPRTPFHHLRPATPGNVLGELSLNDRRVSGSSDIADAKPPPPRRNVTKVVRDLSKRMTWAAGAPRQRNSSIQPEADFYSKPYGELKAATPPVIQTLGGARQASSGNDYDLSSARYAALGRRNVSGKVAEEGMAGENGEYFRYDGGLYLSTDGTSR